MTETRNVTGSNPVDDCCECHQCLQVRALRHAEERCRRQADALAQIRAERDRFAGRLVAVEAHNHELRQQVRHQAELAAGLQRKLGDARAELKEMDSRIARGAQCPRCSMYTAPSPRPYCPCCRQFFECPMIPTP